MEDRDEADCNDPRNDPWHANLIDDHLDLNVGYGPCLAGKVQLLPTIPVRKPRRVRPKVLRFSRNYLYSAASTPTRTALVAHSNAAPQRGLEDRVVVHFLEKTPPADDRDNLCRFARGILRSLGSARQHVFSPLDALTLCRWKHKSDSAND